MLAKFNKTFGTPEDVVLCIGDWNQGQYRKFHEPIKGIGFRKLFRRVGYKVYLVDEFSY